MIQIFMAAWPAYLVLLLLGLSTVSTKAAGAFWLSLIVLGIYDWLKKSRQNLLPCANPPQDTLNNIAKGWLIFCLVALAIKTIPMVYWSGPWQERHAEFRLLGGAIGSYLLLKYQRLPKNWGTVAGHALAAACLLSFVLAAFWGSNEAPTNRIPWAAGVSVLSCLLLTWSFLELHNNRIRRLWQIFSLLGVCTVLISGVRGSYLLLLVWPTLWWVLGQWSGQLQTTDKLKEILVGLTIVIAAVTLSPHAETPMQRGHAMVTDLLGHEDPSQATYANSSTGARMVLWKAGLEAFQNHWFIGLGFAGGKDLIKQVGNKSQSDTVNSLGHFHNDYIHTAVEFGIFGLLSYLVYSLGIAWCAWRLYGAGRAAAATGLLAILFMHMSTALSNMNFAHNYYPTVLSVAITLLLLSPRLQNASSNR